MGKNEAEFTRWFEQAKDDLAAARDSNKAGHHEWACFQAQQSAGKALKSYLLFQGKRQFVSHSIRDLLHEAEQLDSAFATVSKTRHGGWTNTTSRRGIPTGFRGWLVPTSSTMRKRRSNVCSWPSRC